MASISVYFKDNLGNFTAREDVHPYNTRGRSSLAIPRLSKALGGGFPVLALKTYKQFGADI